MASVSQRAIETVARELLNYPPNMPLTLMDLAVACRYSEGHMSRVIEIMVGLKVVDRLGNGGRAGYQYAINRDRCAALIGDYADDMLDRAA